MAGYGLSDHPLRSLSEDTLGLSSYAGGLAKFIRSCDTPLTVAIQGDWGTGKTSLMYMVQSALAANEGGDKIKIAWFNTWQYSQFSTTDDLPVSLLSSLFRQISDRRDLQRKFRI